VEGFASDWFLHDELRIICKGTTQVVLHPLKFPDLTTCYYLLFPKPKLVLKRKRTGNIIVIKKNVGYTCGVQYTGLPQKLPTMLKLLNLLNIHIKKEFIP
jgi:hypothetical protein